MTRYLGGLITKDESLVLPANNFEDTSAPGVWTLEEAQALNKQGLWPTAGVDNPVKFVENLFSIDVYAGTASSNTITTGIDLANNTGMVWGKRRDVANSHWVVNTANTATSRAEADGTFVSDKSSSFTSFNSNGFTVATGDPEFNASGGEYVAWTFRATPKFFDVVTYTGTGSARTVSHSLGSVPGMIIIKNISQSDNWAVYHRGADSSAPEDKYLILNSDAAVADSADWWNDTAPTSSVFTVGTDHSVNASSENYVAYIFGHDTSSDGMIQCGSYSSATDVNLGFEPQWLIAKRYSSSGNWYMLNTVTGFTAPSGGSVQSTARLVADLSAVEGNDAIASVLSTGFKSTLFDGSGDYIYMAIRKGKMQTPTSSSNVFGINAFTTTSSISTIYDLGIKHDMVIGSGRAGSNVPVVEKRIQSRLTGMGKVGGNAQQLLTNSNSSESGRSDFNQAASSKNAVQLDAVMFDNTFITTGIFWAWSIAKGYFDVVAYTGNESSGRQITHNLGVAPEMIWIKERGGTSNWVVYHKGLNGGTDPHNYVLTGLNNGYDEAYNTAYFGAAPTSTTFTIGNNQANNENSIDHVAYLFASATGVSKVGSFSHSNGSSTDVDCGFSSGSKFVLVKDRDQGSDSGDWYVWDSTRGIVSGNDPYTLFNTTAAEVTNTDYIDTLSSGFQIASGFATGDYIFYAIAA